MQMRKICKTAILAVLFDYADKEDKGNFPKAAKHHLLNPKSRVDVHLRKRPILPFTVKQAAPNSTTK